MDWTPDNWQDEQKAIKRTMAIDKYRNDAVVIRTHSCSRKPIPPTDTTEGGAPSRKSLNNLVFILNNCDVPMSTMATLTIQKDVSIYMTVAEHKALLKAFIQRLRRIGLSQYVWVREFTKNEIPHWHLFCDLQTGNEGVDVELSCLLSAWAARYCRRVCKDSNLDVALTNMEIGDGRDFLGCVRIERLRDDAAGRYAGKEGAKRFQKVAPTKWNRSGTWWDKSRNITCTALERVQVRTSSLQSVTITTAKGEVFDVPYKNQFGRGKSIELRKGKKDV